MASLGEQPRGFNPGRNRKEQRLEQSVSLAKGNYYPAWRDAMRTAAQDAALLLEAPASDNSFMELAYALEAATSQRAHPEPKFLILLGPQNVGKTTIRLHLAKLGFANFRNHVTRPPRLNEQPEREAHFVTETELDAMQLLDELLAPPAVQTHSVLEPKYRSGASKREFVDLYKSGTPFVIERRLTSWDTIKANLRDLPEIKPADLDDALIVFLLPPSLEELTARAVEKAFLATETNDGNELAKQLERTLGGEKASLITEAATRDDVIFVVNDDPERVISTIVSHFLLPEEDKEEPQLTREEKTRRMTGIVEHLKEKIREKNLPATVLLNGSAAYKGIDRANDLDLYLIVDDQALSSGITGLLRALEIDVDPSLVSDQDARDLLNGSLTRLVFLDVPRDGVTMDIKIATMKGLEDVLSSTGVNDFTTRYKFDDTHPLADDVPDPQKQSKTYTGEDTAVDYVLTTGSDFLDKTVPRSTYADNSPIVHSILESLLVSTVAIDQAQFQGLHEKIWADFARAVLAHNNLIADGKPTPKASDVEYIKGVIKGTFIKPERYTEEFIDRVLVANYLRQLIQLV